MKVLVTYATRHGSTAGIAERIAAVLTGQGHPAKAVSVDRVDDVTDYDAVVLGGAAYLTHWLKSATRFAYRQQEALAGRPVWLFSSGPLDRDDPAEAGAVNRDPSRPREFAELDRLLSPRGERVFYRSHDPGQSPIGPLDSAPAPRPRLPATAAEGVRDWDDVERWANKIAAELTTTSA